MSLFNRIMTGSGGGNIPQPARQGQGWFAYIKPTIVATDAAAVLTVAQLALGAIVFSGFTAGRNLTTPAAADIIAAAPDMDIGDTFIFSVSVLTAFAGTFVAGTGVTLAGRATCPASEQVFVVVEKTGAATVTWTVL